MATVHRLDGPERSESEWPTETLASVGENRRVPRRWWTPYAALAGAIVAGMVLSRVPGRRLLGMAARVVRTGASVAVTGATVAVAVAVVEPRRRPRPDVKRL